MITGAHDSGREERDEIARVRKAIEAGEYAIPALDVADAILAFHRDVDKTDTAPIGQREH